MLLLASQLSQLALAQDALSNLPTSRCRSSYTLNEISQVQMQIDGRADEPIWQHIPSIRQLHSPWDNSPPAETEFQAFADTDSLYFIFKARDIDLVVGADDIDVDQIRYEDRVELMLSTDADMKRYLVLEMDAKARVMAYWSKHFREFEPLMSLPQLQLMAGDFSSLENAGSVRGFLLEGALPLAWLKAEGLLADDPVLPIFAGVFRADFHTHSAPWKVSWLSWSLPGTAKPEFHIPAALGCWNRRSLIFDGMQSND